MNAAKDGEEVLVTRNVDLSKEGLIVDEGKAVVLNTNGFTVEAANTAIGQITVNGTLTIRDGKGSGSIAYTGSNGKSSFGMVEVADGGKLILESGAKIDAAEGGFRTWKGIKADSNTGICCLPAGLKFVACRATIPGSVSAIL